MLQVLEILFVGIGLLCMWGTLGIVWWAIITALRETPPFPQRWQRFDAPTVVFLMLLGLVTLMLAIVTIAVIVYAVGG